jgi:succinate dehydrogenase / fumarate reductase cytochrome b subunit
MSGPKRYPNRLGLKGWAVGGRWGIERYAYFLHRLTGLALLFYFVLHIFVTSLRVFSQEMWESVMTFLTQPGVNVGEFLIFLAFGYHAANGVRLIAIEMFGAVGKPIEPIYPYRTSIHTQRPLLIIMMIIMVIFIAAGTYDFLVLGHH